MALDDPKPELETGPTWARLDWPPQGDDDLTAALDPTRMAVAVKRAAAKVGDTLSEAEVARSILRFSTSTTWTARSG